MNLQEKRERYVALCHAMQTGVAYKLEKDPSDTTPKHLRVGINSALVQDSALALLLMKKGIIQLTVIESEDFMSRYNVAEIRHYYEIEQRLDELGVAGVFNEECFKLSVEMYALRNRYGAAFLAELKPYLLPSSYGAAINEFVQATLSEARKYGWVIDNLNDNDKGWTVKGPAWKVTTPLGGAPRWFWSDEQVAFQIAAEVLLASSANI